MNLKQSHNSFVFSVKVIPSAPNTIYVGYRGGKAVIKVNAPPEAGKANRELISFLADKLDIAKAEIRLVRGHSSRYKAIAFPLSEKEKVESFFHNEAT